MDILKSLGVDDTLWMHLVCFLVSYVALTQLVFKPYLRAFAEREKRTVGGEETAVRLIQEASNLQTEYEQKAKAINSQIKAAFDSSRSQALKEYEQLLEKARAEAAALVEQSRTALNQNIQIVRKELSNDIPAVSGAIASKLAGKDLTA